MFKCVYLLLICCGVLIVGLLVFIELMKELNVVILLCLFNFEIFVIYVYNYVLDECLELVVLFVILLVLVGFIFFVMVNCFLE